MTPSKNSIFDIENADKMTVSNQGGEEVKVIKDQQKIIKKELKQLGKHTSLVLTINNDVPANSSKYERLYFLLAPEKRLYYQLSIYSARNDFDSDKKEFIADVEKMLSTIQFINP